MWLQLTKYIYRVVYSLETQEWRTPSWALWGHIRFQNKISQMIWMMRSSSSPLQSKKILFSILIEMVRLKEVAINYHHQPIAGHRTILMCIRLNLPCNDEIFFNKIYEGQVCFNWNSLMYEMNEQHPCVILVSKYLGHKSNLCQHFAISVSFSYDFACDIPIFTAFPLVACRAPRIEICLSWDIKNTKNYLLSTFAMFTGYLYKWLMILYRTTQIFVVQFFFTFYLAGTTRCKNFWPLEL